MERAFLTLAFTGFFAFASSACITCNKPLRREIYDSTFYPNLLIMLSAFIVIGLIVIVLARISTRRHQARIAGGEMLPDPVPLTTAAMVLGIGLGGFADGILLHQVLQWHEMLSNKVPVTDLMGKSVNMFWDGVFHFFCLVVVLIGVILSWKLLRRPDTNRSGKLLAGGMLCGWGLFNVVEGIIDHHLLRLHNVREATSDPELWNFGFLAFSLVLLVTGALLVRKGTRAAYPR
jgi:uncharacterized membrane protein